MQTMTDDAERADLLLLGGNTRAKPTAGDPPSDGGGGGGGDDDGGLPVTGDSVPVPLLVSVALALIIAGATLTWRARRRWRTFVS